MYFPEYIYDIIEEYENRFEFEKKTINEIQTRTWSFEIDFKKILFKYKIIILLGSKEYIKCRKLLYLTEGCLATIPEKYGSVATIPEKYEKELSKWFNIEENKKNKFFRLNSDTMKFMCDVGNESKFSLKFSRYNGNYRFYLQHKNYYYSSNYAKQINIFYLKKDELIMEEFFKGRKKIYKYFKLKNYIRKLNFRKSKKRKNTCLE